MKKNKKFWTIASFFALTVFLCMVSYAVRNFSFASTTPARSLAIFTQISMQDNFTDAALIGLGNPETVSNWRKNYQTINAAYFSSEFKGMITPQTVDRLLAAELSMNRRRKIEVSDIKVTGNSATAKISISKVNYSKLIAAAIQKTKTEKAAEKLDTPQKFSEKLADNLILAFENATISDQMTSFVVACQKVTITNAPKDLQIKTNELDGFFLYLMEHVAGHCWYPKDPNSYFYKLDQAIEQ